VSEAPRCRFRTLSRLTPSGAPRVEWKAEAHVAIDHVRRLLKCEPRRRPRPDGFHFLGLPELFSSDVAFPVRSLFRRYASRSATPSGSLYFCPTRPGDLDQVIGGSLLQALDRSSSQIVPGYENEGRREMLSNDRRAESPSRVDDNPK